MPEPAETPEIRLTVPLAEQGQRLDRYVAVACAGRFSRSQIKQLILAGRITVNRSAVKPHYQVRRNDVIGIPSQVPVAQTVIPPLCLALDIIYEDEYLIAVNKPAGLVVHPGAGHRADTLVNALVYHSRSLAQGSSPEKPGIVHRLDKDTSGVLLVAKDDYAFRQLSHQFRQRLTHKTYCAIVVGEVAFDEGVIDAPLSRSPLQRMQMRIMYDSPRQALTRYRTVKRSSRLSVLDVFPHTGRTHQIRVHLASLGHPVLGDSVYGRSRGPQGLINRQALHARELVVWHPYRKTQLTLSAPVPGDMQRIIDTIPYVPKS